MLYVFSLGGNEREKRSYVCVWGRGARCERVCVCDGLMYTCVCVAGVNNSDFRQRDGHILRRRDSSPHDFLRKDKSKRFIFITLIPEYGFESDDICKHVKRRRNQKTQRQIVTRKIKDFLKPDKDTRILRCSDENLRE